MILSHDLKSFCCWKIRVSRELYQKSLMLLYKAKKCNSFWPTYAAFCFTYGNSDWFVFLLNISSFCLSLCVTLHLSKDVVQCIGAGERYVYRRNPGWTQITFTNLKRPSSKLHKVKGWFSSKGFFQLFYFGKKLQVLPESIFYYWFSTLCFCTFACYSKIFFNLNLPDFFLIKTKAAEVIFWPQG